MGVRVLVVDPRALLGAALTDVLARHSDIDEAVAAAPAHLQLPLPPLRWDVVVADGGSAHALSAHLSGARLVVLVDAPDVARIASLVSDGASAICLPDDGVEDVARAVSTVAEGRMRLPPALVGPILEEVLKLQARTVEAQQALNRLTDREREVLRLLADGLRRREIAERLGISPHTVRTHVQHLIRKMSLQSDAEARAVGRRLLGMDERSAGVHSAGLR